MSLKDPMKWNARVSAVYAVGIWTMVGSYAYFKYTGRYDDIEVRKEVEEPLGPNQKVYKTAHSKSIISYKEGFVPYSTRIYNFIKSFSGEPGPEDSKK
ncbi:small integral membrane protein 26-like [Fundulus heteroclitus]|uniref:small integral membrane protein 26-like n=1 Tax=Fundulus heteroclitus TaxID=8078 RepID=UPI00079DA420|nr:small integral membrane protein 26-like [Fundulus heteroclitus]